MPWVSHIYCTACIVDDVTFRRPACLCLGGDGRSGGSFFRNVLINFLCLLMDCGDFVCACDAGKIIYFPHIETWTKESNKCVIKRMKKPNEKVK